MVSKAKPNLKINLPVFVSSSLLILAFIVFTLTNLETAASIFGDAKNALTRNFGWLFNGAVQVFLVFALYMALGRFGKIRIGGEQARPEYSSLTWFAMLFSAGMGIGLMFWGVAEPIYHFSGPATGEGGTPEAAAKAMQTTFLHWGVHGWAIYALVGLTIAYHTFNKGMPLTISAAFTPLLGEKWVKGGLGQAIDVVAVVATLFGVATSLGLGASQVSAGLDFLFGITQSNLTSLVVIGGITLMATISVVYGLDKGVKRLSQVNLIGAAMLLVFVLLVGPTLFILESFLEHLGLYLDGLIKLSSWNDSYRPDSNWQGSWTVFYWAWWISWSPFVGIFIARISRGRTIREFVFGVLLVPAIITCFWINAFGGAALFNELFGAGGVTEAVNNNVATALYVLLEQYPLGKLAAFAAMFMVVIFFITSSDSGSLVIDYLASGGELNPPKAQRIFWAVLEGLVASALMLGGGLAALQTATILSGLPFVFVLLLMMVSLLKSLRQDYPVDQVDIERPEKVSAA